MPTIQLSSPTCDCAFSSVTGASLASDWCAHEIAMMKKNAVSFSFQAEQSLLEFRNRLIEWHERPSRAKKLFKNDLDSWAYDTSLADQELVAQQQAWAAQHSAVEPGPAPRRDPVDEIVLPTPAAGSTRHGAASLRPGLSTRRVLPDDRTVRQRVEPVPPRRISAHTIRAHRTMGWPLARTRARRAITTLMRTQIPMRLNSLPSR